MEHSFSIAMIKNPLGIDTFFFLTYCHYSKGLVFFCSRVSSVPTFLFASNVRGKKKGGKIVKPILHDEKFLEKKKKK